MFLNLSRKLFLKPGFCCVRVKHFIRSMSDDQSYSFFEDEYADLQRVREERAEIYLNNLDDELKEKKKKIESFIEQWQSECRIFIPDKITAFDWWELLQNCSSVSHYTRYLSFVALSEREMPQRIQEKMEQRKIVEENNEQYDQLYHLNPVRDLHRYAWKKLTAWRSENPIVIDLDFPEIHGKLQRKSVHGIKNAIRKNVFSPEPSNIHLTSFRNFAQMTDFYNAKSMLLASTFCEEHFLDLFPREKIIYLSPDAPPMFTFDPEAVYVVGGIQTTSIEQRNLTFLKAQKYGVKCASFPIKGYARLKVSSSFTLDIGTSVSIINSMYYFNCWKKAFSECLDPDYFTMMLDENDIKNPIRARLGSKIHLQTINDVSLRRLREITLKKR